MAIGQFTKQRFAWQRRISLILLICCGFDLAIADVLIPGICDREGEMLLVTGATRTPSVTDQHFIIISQPDQHPPKTNDCDSIEDDCICCCAHLVPIAIYQYARPIRQSERMNLDVPPIPCAPPAELNHPPRT